jgi:pyruvate formate-lyase activating enzyme-like uncharacterized protein
MEWVGISMIKHSQPEGVKLKVRGHKLRVFYIGKRDIKTKSIKHGLCDNQCAWCPVTEDRNLYFSLLLTLN